MDLEQIVSLITTLGFPIFCCLIMWKQMLTMQAQHKEELNNVTAALNNNTLVIQQLVDKLDLDK